MTDDNVKITREPSKLVHALASEVSRRSMYRVGSAFSLGLGTRSGSVELGHDQGPTYLGVTITFEDVVVEVGKRSKTKRILDSLDGFLQPGTVTALMGPSGSGKTTLIDVLTGQKTPSAGKVLYNGGKATQQFLKYGIAYAAQEESLIENMTAKEVMYYSYDLERGQKSDKKEAARVIDGIVGQLGLDSCFDTLVGGPLRKGLSGGQKKRLSIAVAMLGRPQLLVLDEPTSGLDSYTSLEVMTAITHLSYSGLTVLSSIHSPSPSVFQLFDRLLMLLSGGIVYFGEVRTGEHAAYFGQLGFSRHPACANDADWLSEIVAESMKGSNGLDGSQMLVDVYRESDLRAKNLREQEAMSAAIADGTKTVATESYKQPMVKRLGIWPTWAILKHRLIADYREPFYTVPRVGEKLIFAFVIVTIYLNFGRDSNALISDSVVGLITTNITEVMSYRLGIATCLFMWGLLPAFGTLATIPSLFSERALYHRESGAGYYSAVAFLLSRVVEEAILITTVSLITAVAIYYGVGLYPSYWLFWLAHLFTSICGVLLAYAFAAASPTADFALIIDAGYNIILLFFTGFLIRKADMPDYWEWAMYINYMHFAWAALMKNQFSLNQETYGATQALNGEIVLQYYGLDDSTSGWGYLGYLAIFVCAFFIIGVLSLRFITRLYIKR